MAQPNLQEPDEEALPIFKIERVQLQFSVSANFVAAQVANNVLILALSTGRLLRIDLDSPSDIDDIDLPRKTSDVGLIRHMFLDPSASHLIISTTLGENYYLHTQSRQPKFLSRLKSVGVESIAWNPSLPTASTREILIGASDGNVYEIYIEPSNEFYRREEKYLKMVYKADGPVTGLNVDTIPGKLDARRVLVGTPTRLLHFFGRTGRSGQEGSGSIYSKFFETEAPTQYEALSSAKPAPSALIVSPDPSEMPRTDDGLEERHFAWLSMQGILHGKLQTKLTPSNLGSSVFNSSKMFPRSRIPTAETTTGRKKAVQEPIASSILSQWHIICLVEGRIVAAQRLDEHIVYDQAVLEPGENAIGLFADQKKNTYWLFTTQEIFEIVVTDEDREVWKIMLNSQQFDLASQYAKTAPQKDAVAMASGDYLIGKGQYFEAAAVYGKSSRRFEQVVLTFIDHGEQDALRRYLMIKLSSFKQSFIMQRMMIASWLVEIFMSKMNSLDDTITTKAQLTENSNTADSKGELSQVRREFRDFVHKFQTDLDSKTTYEIISSHGREQELLSYATVINDYNYVLSYWIQRERWQEALNVLQQQTEPETFYKYSSVLMAHVPNDLVDVLMRHPDLDSRKLIPAILNYNKDDRVPLSQNQAVRYLNFCINTLNSTDCAIHNTLISIYASDRSPSESALLSYLSGQSVMGSPSYDVDFAFRLCIQHARVQSAVHIYSSMGQYASAVSLALKHDEIDLASMVADRPAETDPALRKRLWLAVAKKVISTQGKGSIKTAIDLLKRCDLLRIEDLIPFFPDFVVIDEFKAEICAALESYSKSIADLDTEMDASAATAESIKSDIKGLGKSDCLGKKVVEGSGMAIKGRIRDLQASIAHGGRREREGRELDALVAGSCILCGDLAIKQIEEPFVRDTAKADEWAI